jgi:Tol biopolymer transport system component
LEKNPNERFQSMRDIAFDLESLTGLSGTVATSAVENVPRRNFSAWLHRGFTALLFLLLVFLAIQYFKRPVLNAPTIQFSLDPPENPATADNTVVPLQLAVSPDGSQLIFACPNKGTQNILWLRPLSSVNPQPLPGTDNASYPFWSAEGRYVGFFVPGKLKKIDIRTGAVQVICDAIAGRGGAWSPDGTIIFAPDKLGGLYRVSAEGGQPTLVTDEPAKQAITYRWPMFLPDYDHFLYLRQEGSGATGAVYFSSLHSKDHKLLLNANSNVVYVAPGYLLFHRDGKLMGQKFDWQRQTFSGEIFSVSSEQVTYNQTRGFSTFSASMNGVVSYQPNRISPSSLIWLDRSGKKIATAGEPNYFSSPRISPDGKRIVLVRHETHSEEGDIWLLDLEKNNMSRFTFKPEIYNTPIWTPDGKGILYSTMDVYRKDSSGTGKETRIFKSPVGTNPTSITPDGKYAAVSLDNAKTQQDLWIVPLAQGSPYALLEAEYNENSGIFSPDGRWLAYVSDESGHSEIYVRPFPNKDAGKWQVSTSGGILPGWRPDAKELYFISNQNVLMAVVIKASQDNFDSGTPQPLFPMPLITISGDTLYDVTADGQRFLITNPPDPFRPSISVIVNWSPDLKN